MKTPSTGLIGLFLLVCLVVTGCNHFQQTMLLSAVDLVGAAKVADYQLQSGEITETILSAPLGDSDVSRVSVAFSDYGASRKALESLVGSPMALLSAVSYIKVERLRLHTAYLSLQDVVTRNWDGYQPNAQVRLLQWQQEAYALERKYGSFLDVVRTAEEAKAKEQATIEMLKVVFQIATMVA
jgi:predicted small secreted protein